MRGSTIWIGPRVACHRYAKQKVISLSCENSVDTEFISVVFFISEIENSVLFI